MKRKLFSSAIALSLAALMIGTATPALAVMNPGTASTNEINRTNGWAHVDQISKGVGTTVLRFIGGRNFSHCFEYRTDGDLTQQTRTPHRYNPTVTDGEYPFQCFYKDGIQTSDNPMTASEYVEVRMVFGAEQDEYFTWTRFDVIANTTVVLDGNYAAQLPNGWASDTPAFPQKGTTAQHKIGTGAWESIPARAQAQLGQRSS